MTLFFFILAFLLLLVIRDDRRERSFAQELETTLGEISPCKSAAPLANDSLPTSGSIASREYYVLLSSILFSLIVLANNITSTDILVYSIIVDCTV